MSSVQNMLELRLVSCLEDINTRNVHYQLSADCNNVEQKCSQVLFSHLPEVKHVQQDRDLHQVYPAADVVVPQHHQVATQLQAGLLYQVSLPVTL